MGTPDTHGQCINCGEPVVQRNNTGSWLHSTILNTKQFPDQTLCNNPRIVAEDKSKGTTARKAVKK